MLKFEGTFQGGIIVPDTGCPIPEDGTRVEYGHPEVNPMKPTPPVESKPGWFWDLMKDLVVDDPDSPGDRAAQHDHYAHGAPKR